MIHSNFQEHKKPKDFYCEATFYLIEKNFVLLKMKCLRQKADEDFTLLYRLSYTNIMLAMRLELITTAYKACIHPSIRKHFLKVRIVVTKR